MYMLRYFNCYLDEIDIETYPCWYEALKRARQVKEYYKQPVEIYERREVI